MTKKPPSAETPTSPSGAAHTQPHHSLARAPWLTAPATRRLFDVLEAAGIGVRAVGGTVRNTLLGEPVNDIDLAVDAPPDKVTAAARSAGLKVVPTGIDHGTVTIVVEGTPYEVTTLRRDVTTDGRRATIAYTSDWHEDAERRDFTINALYCDRHGVLLDPVGGLPDIAARHVRFIGDAGARIREDYLRILRFFRFSAQYSGGSLDETGLAACIAERAGLQRLSAERIHHELLRLLQAPAALAVVRRIAGLGFIEDLLGTPADVAALAALIDIEQRMPRTLPPAFATTPDPIMRLATLAVARSDDVPRLKQRLRLSNAEADRLAAAHRVAEIFCTGSGAARLQGLVYRHGNRATADGILLAWARQTAHPDAGTCRLTPRDHADLEAMLATAASWSPPALPITGGDVIALGVPAGPRISAIIEAFETWWIEAGFPNDRARVAARLAELVVVTKQ